MRNEFFICKEMNNHRFDDYIMKLCQRAGKCEFRDLHDFLIKDILIVGLKVLRLTECLLLYQRMVSRKEINTLANTKYTKARKNFNSCTGNK